MPYRNLECSNEKTYRWHTVDDIKNPNDPIIQSIIKDVKDDIYGILIQIDGVNPELVADVMEKYMPRIVGVQTIFCPSCKHLQIDAIIDDQTKIREDLWRSYEADRFVRQFMGDKNGRR